MGYVEQKVSREICAIVEECHAGFHVEKIRLAKG